MRPLRLTLTAFGPYAGSEVVDFDALTELGLFVVAGNNGAGKTTIFDALHYSLFGTLPGRRASYIRLKSDHADDASECSVSLDFTAHGKLWRVERSPKQTRPKRRGNGCTEVERRATLYRLDHGQSGPATAVANKIGEVDATCRELVGLSGKQFERVALLPQGEFSRVLRESSTERRELLRTLFSSEVFGDATTLLSEQAATATAGDRAVLERLDHQQASLAEALTNLTGQSPATSVAELQSSIADYRRVQLQALADEADQRNQQAELTADAHRQAVEIDQRLRRRVQVEREHSELLARQDQQVADISRLELARRAVPVVNLVRALGEQEERHSSATELVGELLQRCNDALTRAGLDPIETAVDTAITTAIDSTHDLDQQLRTRSEAAASLQDLEAAASLAQGELRRITHQISNLDEQKQIAQARHRQLLSQANTLRNARDLASAEQAHRSALAQLHQRQEFAELEAKQQSLVGQLTAVTTSIDQLQLAHERARQAQATLPALQTKVDAAVDHLELATARKHAVERYARATTKLAEVRSEHSRAQTTAEQLWDAFIAGTAARVAETLVTDEPCPVCGSADHPEPAVLEAGGQIVTQAQVSAAREQVDQVHSQLRALQSEIEQLTATDRSVAAASPADAAAEIATAKALALGARTLADETCQVASQADALASQLDQARDERHNLDAQIRSIDQRCNQLRGALADVVHTSVASLEQLANDAAQTVTDAEQRASQQETVEQALAAAQADLDDIGLRQIAAEAKRSAVQAQANERRAECQQASNVLAALDQQLAQQSRTERTESHQERSRACRQAIQIGSELATAVTRHHETEQAVRRARSLLDDRMGQSPFTSPNAALDAYVEPAIVEQLEAQTANFAAADERLRGQLHELADLPQQRPDVDGLRAQADQAAHDYAGANREFISATTTIDRLEHELRTLCDEREALETNDTSTRRLERVAALVKGDNDRNTSLENWVLAAHLRDVVELANIRLARSTHQRFQLCVLDDGENKRGKWGLDLGVEDTVTGTQRPTAGLSGGELFQASLALALGLADAVMNQSAGVRIDALFIDEGFGSLDEVSVERAIDLLDELRDRGSMVGVITHVPALLDALPLGVRVEDAPNGQGSTIHQTRLAA